MPIKSFDVTFKIDVEELFAFVAKNNVAVEIRAVGTKRVQQPQEISPSAEQLMALPAPAPRRRRGLPSTQQVLLGFMSLHPKEDIRTEVIHKLLEQSGFSPKTHGVTHLLFKAGMISRKGRGSYRITAKGLRQAEAINNV